MSPSEEGIDHHYLMVYISTTEFWMIGFVVHEQSGEEKWVVLHGFLIKGYMIISPPTYGVQMNHHKIIFVINV